ncbi:MULTISPECIES: hypothetical protein [unclassified Curtobacterium]|uniref:hypothetical protein n=1 Tax=unclassified Curtobacterium TaxID=257496 RepID=UPI0008DCD689|nr:MULTISPECIES: hypothetical protein [unclassified Curtobacterium]OIH96827.1 hypothetical protein BIU92_03635 [Curtobacterium sp. MCBA15_003]OII09326.1 hypothetical protein BIU97_12365 [Curtobacterium sp. MCBA15_009]OII29109.1 hypothetical protein BIU94_13535 [Curtobacterium sp. MMLR14_006]
MELLFAVLGGVILGAIAHVVLPWRATRGTLVGPAVGGIVAAVLWEALTWAGWPYDGTWIWVVALLGAAAAALVVEFVLGRQRTRRDAEFYDRLKTRGA